MRFLDRLELRTERDPNSGCWLWSGAHHPYGYGLINLGGQLVRVHRLSYALHEGPIPEGLKVCHRCDTPACWWPDHLFVGTNADNLGDAAQKKRFPHGERHYQAGLTDDAVRDIRKKEWMLKEYAARYGVTVPAVHAAQQGRTWKHVQ